MHVPLERDTVQVDDANGLRGAPIKVAIVRSQRLVGDALAALVNQEPDMAVIGNLDYGDVSQLVVSEVVRCCSACSVYRFIVWVKISEMRFG